MPTSLVESRHFDLQIDMSSKTILLKIQTFIQKFQTISQIYTYFKALAGIFDRGMFIRLLRGGFFSLTIFLR